MTSRLAAPESETPETDAMTYAKGAKCEWHAWAHLNRKNGAIPLDHEIEAYNMVEFARSLERRLSLAQTEIKGHMRVEEELKAQVARLIKERDLYAEFAGNNVVMQARIAELEKLLRDVIDANPRYNATAELGNRIDAALKDRA